MAEAGWLILLPSLWLLLAITVPEGEGKLWPRALFYLAILLTLVGPLPDRAALAGDHCGIRADTRQAAARRGGRRCSSRYMQHLDSAINNQFSYLQRLCRQRKRSGPGCTQGQGHLRYTKC